MPEQPRSVAGIRWHDTPQQQAFGFTFRECVKSERWHGKGLKAFWFSLLAIS